MLVLTNLEVYQMIQVKRLRTEVVLIVGGALAILFPSGLAFSQAFTPADAIAQGYSQAPHNLLIHPSCVHSVPLGAHIWADQTVTLEDGGFLAHYAECPYPAVSDGPTSGGQDSGSGGGVMPDDIACSPGDTACDNGFASYEEGVGTDGGYAWDYVYSVWYVPEEPSVDAGQSIAFFNDIETLDGTNTIIQPVLEWGLWNLPNSGGWRSWTLVDIVLINGTLYSGDFEPVTVGDEVTGTIVQENATEYEVEWNDLTAGTSWYVYVEQTSSCPSGYVCYTHDYVFDDAESAVMEVHSVGGCDQLPASGNTTFYNVALEQGYPSWNSNVAASGVLNLHQTSPNNSIPILCGDNFAIDAGSFCVPDPYRCSPWVQFSYDSRDGARRAPSHGPRTESARLRLYGHRLVRAACGGAGVGGFVEWRTGALRSVCRQHLPQYV